LESTILQHLQRKPEQGHVANWQETLGTASGQVSHSSNNTSVIKSNTQVRYQSKSSNTGTGTSLYI
jgi:hypothetical protein